jgi:hypothetical protein
MMIIIIIGIRPPVKYRYARLEVCTWVVLRCYPAWRLNVREQGDHVSLCCLTLQTFETSVSIHPTTNRNLSRRGGLRDHQNEGNIILRNVGCSVTSQTTWTLSFTVDKRNLVPTRKPVQSALQSFTLGAKPVLELNLSSRHWSPLHWELFGGSMRRQDY